MAGMSGWQRAEFTSAAGTRKHAAVLGPADAPDVVCVHGPACSHRYFLPRRGGSDPAHRWPLRSARLERPTLAVVAARDYLDCGPRRWLATFRYLNDDPIERKPPILAARGLCAAAERGG